MSGNGRPLASLTRAKKAARKKDLDGYSWALLEHMVDCHRQGSDGLIGGRDAIALLNTLHKKVSPPPKETEDKLNIADTDWLSMAGAEDSKKKTL